MARVRLLGGFHLSAADGAAIPLASRRARSILAMACLEGEAGVLRERVCGLLWSDRPEDQARASLRQCLFELRAALGEVADGLLDIDRERIAARSGTLDTDVAQIRRALASAAEADLAALPALLTDGALLEGLEIHGLFQEWLDQTRGAFEASLAADVLRCLARLEGEGRWTEAVALADGYLRRDPLHEAVAAAALRAERASGLHAAAERRYQAIRQRLAEDLGVAPGPVLAAAALASPAIPPGRLGAHEPTLAATPPEAGRAADASPVLAVLAFDNLSGDPGLAYLGDGVADEVHHAVTKGSDLKVIGRASSFQFRGADKAARRIAAELHATHLLDGAIHRSGELVRISAQLVQCDNETTLWAARFDGDLADVFGLQDRIAEAVAQALKVTFATSPAAARLDPRAYELFLRARAILAEGGQFFDRAGAAAAPLLEEVVKVQPDHAAAWELLANARAIIVRSGARAPAPATDHAGVIAAAETALRLDPKRGGAYVALARLQPWGAYAAREGLLDQALAVSPHEPATLTEMSIFRWSVGRFREALALAEQACALNPLMPSARLQVAEMLIYVGDYEAAMRMHEEIYRRWPGNFEILISLLNCSASLGFWDLYRRFTPEAARFEGWQAQALGESLRYTEALASQDPEAAQQMAARYRALLARNGTLPLNYLEALSAVGLTDTAFELAEQASFDHMFDPHGPLPSGSFPGTVLGRWSALNKTPRFVDLCDRLGLCAYWSQTQRWPDCVDWAPYDFKAAVRRAAPAAGPARYAEVE